MEIEIKSHLGAGVLFTHEVKENSIRITLEAAVQAKVNLRYADLEGADLEGADLEGANLGCANLRYANLEGANLRYANLRFASLVYANLRFADLEGTTLFGASGNLREVKVIQCERWPVTYTSTHMQIGCQHHALIDWWDFEDARIASMAVDALAWWRKWKPILQAIVAASPAD